MDQAHASQADRSAAALMLASSIADTLLRMAGGPGRIERCPRARGTLRARSARSAKRASAPSSTPRTSWNAPALALADVREQIAALEGSAKLRVVALAALAGRAASGTAAELHAGRCRRSAHGLPDDVRIDLIPRRADITASRWRVEAAEHNRESARAEFFPGHQHQCAGRLSEHRCRDAHRLRQPGAAATAAIHLPIFDAGRLKARYGAAQAAVDSAVASYQDTVVGAARDVATQASSLAQIAAEQAERAGSSLDAASALEAARRRASGRVSSIRGPNCAPPKPGSRQRDALLQLDAAARIGGHRPQARAGRRIRKDQATP